MCLKGTEQKEGVGEMRGSSDVVTAWGAMVLNLWRGQESCTEGDHRVLSGSLQWQGKLWKCKSPRSILPGPSVLAAWGISTEMFSSSVNCEMGEPWKGVVVGRQEGLSWVFFPQICWWVEYDLAFTLNEPKGWEAFSYLAFLRPIFLIHKKEKQSVVWGWYIKWDTVWDILS